MKQKQDIISDIESLKNTTLEATFLMEEQAAEIRGLRRELGSLHSEIGKLKRSLDT